MSSCLGGSLSLYLCHVLGLCKSNPRQLSLQVVLTGGTLGYTGPVLAYFHAFTSNPFVARWWAGTTQETLAARTRPTSLRTGWWAATHKEALAGGRSQAALVSKSEVQSAMALLSEVLPRTPSIKSCIFPTSILIEFNWIPLGLFI